VGSNRRSPINEVLDEYLQDAAVAHGHLSPARYSASGSPCTDFGCWESMILKAPIESSNRDFRRNRDRCATDAVALVTNCRLGKRALKFRDWGKMAATFIDIQSVKRFASPRSSHRRRSRVSLHPELESKNSSRCLPTAN
jgi:formylmethanofuran dehydrogenase subunit E